MPSDDDVNARSNPTGDHAAHHPADQQAGDAHPAAADGARRHHGTGRHAGQGGADPTDATPHPDGRHGHEHGSAQPQGHFDEVAATWDDDPAKLERARASADLLRSTLPLRGTERVLEIGGGTGQLSLNLADAVGSVLVTDASDGMVAMAAANIERAGLSSRLSARRLDPTVDALPNNDYDGVWSQLALHHVHDVDLVLRAVHGAIVPGGWLAVIELDADRSGSFHEHLDGFTGHHGFDRGALAERMAAAGFRDVTVRDAGSVARELENKGRSTFGMFLAIGYA